MSRATSNTQIKEDGAYPAKILLLGEYSILMGSDALAIPLHRMSGFWQLPGSQALLHKTQADSNGRISELYHYLSSQNNIEFFQKILNLDRLKSEIEQLLYFDSDIPSQYGLGSSGALVAGVFERFSNFHDAKNLSQLREILARIESFFHSRSSGIDPLVSLLRKPILISNGEPSQVGVGILDSLSKEHFFLMDAGISGMTKNGVTGFWDQLSSNPEFRLTMEQQYIPLVNQLIKEMTSKNHTFTLNHWLQLTSLQLQLFPNLFPRNVKSLAEEGLARASFAVKICGSGGGGFFLVIARNYQSSMAIIKQAGLSIFAINN